MRSLRILPGLSGIAIVLGLLAVSPAFAQTYSPGGACPVLTAGRVFSVEGDGGPALVCNGTTLDVYESVLGGPTRKGIATATPYTTLDVNGEVKLGTTAIACDANRAGAIRYSGGAVGWCNGTAWQSLSGGGGGALSGITAATATNMINSGTYAQEWQWNTLAGNTGFKLSSNSTAATGNAQKLFEIALSGANATAAQTTYGASITNTHTGTTSTNVGLFVGASGGATANYAIQLDGDTAAQAIAMSRETTAATAGWQLTLLAGGADAGSSNLAGGTLNLSAGTATGNGSSSITFQTVMPGQGTGSTDRTPATSMTLASNALTLPSGTTAQQPGQAGMQAASNGMVRYNATNNKFEVYENGAWTNMVGGAASPDRGIQFNNSGSLGASANLIFTSSGRLEILSGDGNVLIGKDAGVNDDGVGNATTALGFGALYANQGGAGNTAVGYQTLYRNIGGVLNTAVGLMALKENTGGAYNTAVGASALDGNTTGYGNTALGFSALGNNTTGGYNTAIGDGALPSNVSGSYNVAVGPGALQNNSVGFDNIVIGAYAVGDSSNADGYMTRNTVIGHRAGYELTGGVDEAAGPNGNTLIGWQAGDIITTGDQNIIIGMDTDPPTATTSNHLNIGNTIYGDISATGKIGIEEPNPQETLHVNGRIRFETLATATATSICRNTSAGGNVLSSCSSSIRYKENVKDAFFGLDEVLQIRPVTFKWKDRDEDDIGFIAEEMEKINPLFVSYENGRVEGVKYPQMTAVLVNAIKEQQAEIDTLSQEISELKKMIASMQ